MSVCMGQLINDAKDLVTRLKERETNLDQVITQSNALAKRVDAIQQLENEYIKLNEKAHHKSKEAVLSNIQKENKIIKLLQQENEELKESLEEHQSVLELIMKKYRQQLSQIIMLKQQQEENENIFKINLMQSLQEKTDQIADMISVMKEAINIDEKNAHQYQENLSMLELENNGLREVLGIKVKYGVHDVLLNRVDKQIQTDDDSK